MERLQSGSWLGVNGSWRFHSAAESVYDTEAAANRALLDWARWHTTVEGKLSRRRCVALVEEAASRWRLWQVIRREQTLASALEVSLTRPSREKIDGAVLGIVSMLREAHTSLAGSGLLLNLDTLGRVDGKVVYVAPVPTMPAIAGLQRLRPSSALDLSKQLEPILSRIRGSGRALLPGASGLLDEIIATAAA